MPLDACSCSNVCVCVRACAGALQMTGLDVEKDQIIEMACLITDSDLNILAEVMSIFLGICPGVDYMLSEVCVHFYNQGPNLIIKQPDELLDGMSEWCQEHHGKVSRDIILSNFDK